MSVKSTQRGGAAEHPDNYAPEHPRVKFTSGGQAQVVRTGPFTKEENQRLDRLYGTSPYSPLHTSNRFPD